MYRKDDIGPEHIVEVYDQHTGMKGVLVIDNTALGLGKGGIRFVRDITTEEVMGLARAMTWKNALAGLPFGGAKSGILGNPREVNKEAYVRSFARKIKQYVPDLYIAGPDMNMTEKEMAQIAEELGNPKAATGKPASMGGLPHELGSTGYGVALSTKVAIEHQGKSLEGMTVAIEGFGNVGTFTMKFLTEWGAKVVAVSDSKGAIYDEAGLDYGELFKTKQEKRTVTAHEKGKVLEGPELFKLPVDILIPGARPNVITMENVNGVKAKYLPEAANIPIKYDVEKVLMEKGVLIIPDILANSGGVISSYCETEGWDEKKMFEVVTEKITHNTKLMVERLWEGNDARAAAMSIARERVEGAMAKKG